MVTPASAKSFRGDMENLVLCQEKFSAFLNGTLASFKIEETPPSTFAMENTFPADAMRFYLAQCPIFSIDSSSNELLPGPLSSLQQDFSIPSPLVKGTTKNSPEFHLSHINFWATIQSPVTSSLHYDPYHNLLCVVTGQKIVRLLPPSAMKYLHNVASIYAESTNHADDDLFHPERKDELENESNSQLIEFILNPGDALYLPEGWWHQIKSTAGTMAVNFWWVTSTNLSSKDQNEEGDMKVMSNYKWRQEKLRQLGLKKEKLLVAACREAYERQRVDFKYDGEIGLETPLNQDERHYILQLKQSMECREGEAMPKEAIETKLLALLHYGALPLMRILRILKKEYPGMIAVLLMKVDSPKMWEALTAGLEDFVTKDYFDRGEDTHGSFRNWVDKAGGIEKTLSSFYDDLYSDVGCDRKIITGRMLNLKEEFAKEAYESLCSPTLRRPISI